MAKKKSETKNNEVESVVDVNLEQETVDVQAEVEAPNDPETIQEDDEVISEQSVKEDMIPGYAKRILKMYPTVKEMYISRLGGVFVTDTKPELRGNAILYQNPYYKS